jgi:hypothetical protein
VIDRAMAKARNVPGKPAAAPTQQGTAAPAAQIAPPGDAAQTIATGAAVAGGEREDRIRQAAYRRYLERGAAPGGELEDWLAAEAENAPSPLPRQG